MGWDVGVPGNSVRRADVEPEEIRWLWYPRIARGKVTILEGDPGVGKSYVTAAIAAALSRGERLPTCESFEPCKVLIQRSRWPTALSVIPKGTPSLTSPVKLLA